MNRNPLKHNTPPYQRGDIMCSEESRTYQMTGTEMARCTTAELCMGRHILIYICHRLEYLREIDDIFPLNGKIYAKAFMPVVATGNLQSNVAIYCTCIKGARVLL